MREITVLYDLYICTKGMSPHVAILGSVHTELLAMLKKWKLNIINGIVHTGLSKILSDSYVCGKRQIFTKDFAKQWVGCAISLGSIAITKESLFGIAIAKLSVNGPLNHDIGIQFWKLICFVIYIQRCPGALRGCSYS